MDGSDAALADIAPVIGLDLTGTWHLADCRLTYSNDKIQRPWASSASGYLMYAPDGHMCKSLNYPAADGRIACISYCGTYDIADNRVRHFISVSADIRDVGTVLDQSVNLEHGRLTMSVSPAPAGGVMDYVWNRTLPLPEDSSRPREVAGKNFIPGP